MLAELVLTGVFGAAFYLILDQMRLLKDPVVVVVRDARDPEGEQQGAPDKKERKDAKTPAKKTPDAARKED